MELDVQIRDWREEALNHLLAGAWDKYTKSLASGEVLELEANYDTWVAQALNETIEVEAEPDEAAA